MASTDDFGFFEDSGVDLLFGSEGTGGGSGFLDNTPPSIDFTGMPGTMGFGDIPLSDPSTAGVSLTPTTGTVSVGDLQNNPSIGPGPRVDPNPGIPSGTSVPPGGGGYDTGFGRPNGPLGSNTGYGTTIPGIVNPLTVGGVMGGLGGIPIGGGLSQGDPTIPTTPTAPVGPNNTGVNTPSNTNAVNGAWSSAGIGEGGSGFHFFDSSGSTIPGLVDMGGGQGPQVQTGPNGFAANGDPSNIGINAPGLTFSPATPNGGGTITLPSGQVINIPGTGSSTSTGTNPLGFTLDPSTSAALDKLYGAGVGASLANFLSSGAGYNPQMIQNIIQSGEAARKRGNNDILTNFGNSGNRFSSTAAIAFGDFQSQYLKDVNATIAGLYEKSVSNYMSVLQGFKGDANAQQVASAEAQGQLFNQIGNIVSTLLFGNGQASDFGGIIQNLFNH